MTGVDYLIEALTEKGSITLADVRKAQELEKHGLKEAFKQGVIECGFENSAEDWANEWINKVTAL